LVEKANLLVIDVYGKGKQPQILNAEQY